MQGRAYNNADIEELDKEHEGMFGKEVPYDEKKMFRALADSRVKDVKVRMKRNKRNKIAKESRKKNR